MEAEILNPADLDDAAWRAWHDVRVLCDEEKLAEGSAVSERSHRLSVLHPGADVAVTHWGVWDDTRTRLVAVADLVVPDRPDNRHMAQGSIWVRPDARRQGLGRALLRLLAEGSRDAGRSVLHGYGVQGEVGLPFVEAYGGKDVYLARRSRWLPAETPVGLLEGWVEQAPERAQGYRIVGWDAPTPAEHLEGYAHVLHAMNTAPMQDMDWEPEVFTPELISTWEEAGAKQESGKWVMVAEHVATGEYAGLTEIYFEDDRPQIAFQGNTGVDPAHRDKGLGRWLKGAMGLRLRQERREVEAVYTFNNDSNLPMLSINTEMGFAPHRRFSNYEVQVTSVLD